MPKKDRIKDQYTFNVKPEFFTPPRMIDFLGQIDKVMNLTALARMTNVRHPNTLLMRVKRGTVLGNDPEHEEFSQDVGEILNEVFWILGVGLGHFPDDPYKYLEHFPSLRELRKKQGGK